MNTGGGMPGTAEIIVGSMTIGEAFPEVSVVIPAKNEEKYIRRCLNSLERIDYPIKKIEIILIDNNSTDRTAAIAKEMNVKVISSSAHTIAALRNIGAMHAKGSILAFIDSDILVKPSWLKNAVRHFLISSIGAVGSRPGPDKENMTLVEELWDRMKRPPLKGVRRVGYLSAGNLIVRADLFHRIGGFDEQLETCEDPEFGFRLGKVADIVEDSDIRTIHLRNPKDFTSFYKKEFWHGKGLVGGLKKYRYDVRALPSLLMPVAYLALLIALIISVFIRFDLFLLLLCIFLFLPALYCMRSCIRGGCWSNVASFYYLHLLYMLARSFSFGWCVLGEIQKKYIFAEK